MTPVPWPPETARPARMAAVIADAYPSREGTGTRLQNSRSCFLLFRPTQRPQTLDGAIRLCTVPVFA